MMINRLFKLVPYIAFAVLLCCLFSCSQEKKLIRAEKKLYNLLEKYPSLSRHDTIWKDTTIYLPGKEIKGEVIIDKNYSKIDSIVKSYGAKLDSISRLKLANDIKYYVTNKPILLDTLKADSIGIVFKLWEEKGKLKYLIKINEDSLKIRYSQTITHVEPAKEIHVIKWWDWLAYGLSVWYLYLVISRTIRDLKL